MQNMINRLELPIAGCLLSSALQSDGLFLKLTETEFQTPFSPKVGAFMAIEKAISIPSLDFFISITSIANFGAVGQANYARYVRLSEHSC
jgi:hypothetical protein